MGIICMKNILKVENRRDLWHNVNMTFGKILPIFLFLLLALTACSQDQGANCTLYFSPNGAEGEVPEPLNGQAGTTVTLPDQGELTRKHYDFRGWNTSMGGTGRNYNPGDGYDLSFTATLYARWELQVFTLSFDPDGATGKPLPVEVSYGGTADLPGSSFMDYPHKDFQGWSDGETVYGQGIAYQVLKDTTLKAVWTDHLYAVTFDANGGKVTTEPIRACYGDVITLPSSLYREGMTFAGWSLSDDGQSIGGQMTVSGDVTLYAVWESGE